MVLSLRFYLYLSCSVCWIFVAEIPPLLCVWSPLHTRNIQTLLWGHQVKPTSSSCQKEQEKCTVRFLLLKKLSIKLILLNPSSKKGKVDWDCCLIISTSKCNSISIHQVVIIVEYKSHSPRCGASH